MAAQGHPRCTRTHLQDSACSSCWTPNTCTTARTDPNPEPPTRAALSPCLSEAGRTLTTCPQPHPEPCAPCSLGKGGPPRRPRCPTQPGPSWAGMGLTASPPPLGTTGQATVLSGAHTCPLRAQPGGCLSFPSRAPGSHSQSGRGTECRPPACCPPPQGLALREGPSHWVTAQLETSGSLRPPLPARPAHRDGLNSWCSPSPELPSQPRSVWRGRGARHT